MVSPSVPVDSREPSLQLPRLQVENVVDTAQRQNELALADLMGAGEYGATRVLVVPDGSLVRLNFGRTRANGQSYYFAGVLLSPEALASLKEQLAALEQLP